MSNAGGCDLHPAHSAPHGPLEESVKGPLKSRRVYDAKHRRQTPGVLVMDEHSKRGNDVSVNESFDGCGFVYDFYYVVFGRSSIDGMGRRLDSVVHYGAGFDNAMWDGSRMIYGDGDGRLFIRFTSHIDIIGHEITHGHTQYLSGLGYSGQTGALNEHLSDAFGSMIKQWVRNQTAHDADWWIGDGIFGPGVSGNAIRSLAAPGTAYDDPILGKDPQPAHMRNYVVTSSDNGGVHINSGIPNKAFYIFCTTIGGYSSTARMPRCAGTSLLPAAWRAGLTLLIRALDALAAAVPPITPSSPVTASAAADTTTTDPLATDPLGTDPSFKAGKDL